MLSILKYFYENADVLKKIENAELRDVISMTMLIMNENKDLRKKSKHLLYQEKWLSVENCQYKKDGQCIGVWFIEHL